MSPVAVMVIGTGVGGIEGTRCTAGGRRRSLDRLDGSRLGGRLLDAPDEERDDEHAQGDDSARTHDQRDDPHRV